MSPPPATIWKLSAGRALGLERARVMGILNVTPDSFSDGGRFSSPDQVGGAAIEMVRAGASILDVGGESTRPGAKAVNADEQIRRVRPSIESIRRALKEGGLDAAITVDTTRAAVAAAALEAGADGVNDQSAGRDDPEMLPLVRGAGCGIALMHRLRRPGEDVYSHRHREPPDYGPIGVVEAVRGFLRERADEALAAGIGAASIAIDPGLGFGKTVEQNFDLIRRSARFVELGFPVIGAASRKSFIGLISGVESASQRVAGSIAASVAQRLAGVQIFRAHDVQEQAEALRVADAIRGETIVR